MCLLGRYPPKAHWRGRLCRENGLYPRDSLKGQWPVTPKSTLGTLCGRQREGHTGQEARKPRAVAESSISDKVQRQTPDLRRERRPVCPPLLAQNTLLMFTSSPSPPRSQEPCMIHSSSRSPTPHIHSGGSGSAHLRGRLPVPSDPQAVFLSPPRTPCAPPCHPPPAHHWPSRGHSSHCS